MPPGNGRAQGFYPARPAILLEGSDNPGLTTGLLALLIEETTAGLFRCEAAFGNYGSPRGEMEYIYFDRRELDFGKALEVKFGETRAFDGKITGLEAHYAHTRPPEIVVLAEDRLQDLRMIRRTRTFEDVSDQDVFQRIASDHGLQADVDVNGPTHRVLAQVNQSDLAFLRERARCIDAEVWIESGVLHVQSRARRQGGQATLVYGERLIEFSALADLATQRTALAVSGWDVAAKAAIEEQADAAALGAELGSLQSGASLLQRAFGERKERVVHQSPVTGEEARSLAEAHFRAAARRFVTGRGVAEGDAALRAGALVALQGLGPLFDGDYTVVEARHTFDLRDGLRTHFAVERPGIGS
jgi:phage protein D